MKTKTQRLEWFLCACVAIVTFGVLAGIILQIADAPRIDAPAAGTQPADDVPFDECDPSTWHGSVPLVICLDGFWEGLNGLIDSIHWGSWLAGVAFGFMIACWIILPGVPHDKRKNDGRPNGSEQNIPPEETY